MPPIKTLARECHFLAFIFSKTLILFSKIHTQHLCTFLQIKNLSLVISKAETTFPIWFLKTFFKTNLAFELWLPINYWNLLLLWCLVEACCVDIEEPVKYQSILYFIARWVSLHGFSLIWFFYNLCFCCS